MQWVGPWHVARVRGGGRRKRALVEEVSKDVEIPAAAAHESHRRDGCDTPAFRMFFWSLLRLVLGQNKELGENKELVPFVRFVTDDNVTIRPVAFPILV